MPDTSIKAIRLCACGDHAFFNVARGSVCLISPEDLDHLAGKAWTCVGTGIKRYMHNRERVGNRRPVVSMHRIIMAAAKAEQVDHINHNGLDNRRSNLRLATPALNTANRRFRPKDSERYLGVWPVRNKSGTKYRAVVCRDNKLVDLGRFTSAVDAARARDLAAREFFGEFATLNFPAALAEQGKGDA